MKRRRNLPTTFEELRGLKAAAYIRESTVEQGENSGPEVQRADIQAFADRYGLTMTETYTDLVSGSSTDRRDAFARMLRDAAAGRFGVLLVRDTSRFGRNEYDVMAAEGQLHDVGVPVAFTYDNVLSSASSGRYGLAVKRVQDAEYLDKLSENVSRGYRVRRFGRGHWSGTAPIGYRMGYVEEWNPAKQAREAVQTGTLVIDEVERLNAVSGETYTNADLLRYIGAVYAKGKLGARPLAKHLNDLGYRTVKGTPFTGGSIRHIVENPVYAGWTSWHQRVDKRRHGEGPTEPVRSHEALWDDRLWARIQRVRRGAFRGGLGSGQMRNFYAFRRLLRCDRCGAKLYGESHAHKGDASPLLGYGCITARDRHDCDQRFVASAKLERWVSDLFASVKATDHEYDWGDVATAITAESPEPVVRRDTGRIERQLANVMAMFEMGDLTREQYVAKSRNLKAMLEADRPAADANADMLAAVARHLDDLARLWERATDEEKGVVVAALFKSVTVRDNRVTDADPVDEQLPAVIAQRVLSTNGGSTVAPPDGVEHAPVGTAWTVVRGVLPLVDALRLAA